MNKLSQLTHSFQNFNIFSNNICICCYNYYIYQNNNELLCLICFNNYNQFIIDIFFLYEPVLLFFFK